MFNALKMMRRWARLAPPLDGPLPDGSIRNALDIENFVVLILDTRGRVFQLEGSPCISNGNIRPISEGKTELLGLIDRFGIEDYKPPMVDSFD